MAWQRIPSNQVYRAVDMNYPLADKIFSVSELGSLAADVVARAIGRGVFEAKALSFPGALQSWRDQFSAR